MQREGLSPTALLIWGTEVRRAPTKRNFSCFLTLLSHLFISYTKVFPHIPTFPSEMRKGGCRLGAWRMHEVLQTRLKVLLTLLLLLLLLSLSVMSDSVRPQRRQPTRLPHPWDSPGKNTGVGCHFFLQCIKVKSESEVMQSCPTLRDPMDCSLPGSSIHRIFQARVLEWGASLK